MSIAMRSRCCPPPLTRTAAIFLNVTADTTTIEIALEEWVEHGVAPQRIVATHSQGSLARPMCRYPELARYVGSGDTRDPANFECVNAIDREAFRSDKK
jgi:hypothetical protein